MSGIYIHIPYCRKACHYCNFHFSTSLQSKNELVEAIVKEIDLQKDYLDQKNLTSIYFGGGTPSVLTAKELGLIFNKLAKYYTWSKEIEITFECNPEDLSKDYLQMLAQVGINRLSIGVQSFDDKELRYMNRSHNADQSAKSIQLSQNLFENITIDLIYGSHKSTIESWALNLEKALSFNVPHISSYALTIEDKTAFGQWIAKGKMTNVDEGIATEQFVMLIDALQTAGYDHYEISNFAKPKHYAIHNTNYWNGVKYLGLGPGAHSYNQESRACNIPNNQTYITAIRQGILDKETEVLSMQDKYNEYVLTRLRTMWGIDKKEIKQRFGQDYLLHVEEIIASKEIQKETITIEGNTITLTQEGKHFADRIASTLFIEQH